MVPINCNAFCSLIFSDAARERESNQIADVLCNLLQSVETHLEK